MNVSNVIANDNYTIVLDQYGNGYSKYGDLQVNRYKETDEAEQGIKFYIKNIRNKKHLDEYVFKKSANTG